MKIVVTGGAGFIGSAVVRLLCSDGHSVLNLDSLANANPLTEQSLIRLPDYEFSRTDIRNEAEVRSRINKFEPDAMVHLAAESHVDKSIDAPGIFLETNVLGTRVLLDAALEYATDARRLDDFLFVMVSTDEVFGSLGHKGRFRPDSPYDPRSPYSASKAASDHLARAWFHTFGLRTIVTNSTNNFGPYQHPEKLIPHFLVRAINGLELPVYGDGANMRDWIHVDDHARALLQTVKHGDPGSTYLIGSMNEISNLELTRRLCDALDRELPDSPFAPHEGLIKFVQDRPGHDFRYAVDTTETQARLQWAPTTSLEEGLRQTVRWYLDNEAWWRSLIDSGYVVERAGQLKRSTRSP